MNANIGRITRLLDRAPFDRDEIYIRGRAHGFSDLMIDEYWDRRFKKEMAKRSPEKDFRKLVRSVIGSKSDTESIASVMIWHCTGYVPVTTSEKLVYIYCVSRFKDALLLKLSNGDPDRLRKMVKIREAARSMVAT